MAEHHDILWAIFADKMTSSTAKCAAAALLLKFYNPGTGRCDPSFTTLGKVIGRSRRSAIKATDELKAGDDPWLIVDSTKGGSQSNTNSFRFRFPTGVNLNTGVKDDTGAENDVTGVSSCTGPVSDAAHELSIELSKNHEGESRARATLLPDDFRLDDQTYTWGAKRFGEDIDALDRSIERFCNHFRQVTGKTAKSRDWQARARNWLDDDAKRIGSGKAVAATAGLSNSGMTDLQWEPIIARFVKTGIWTRHVDLCGNAPPASDCRAPWHLLLRYGLVKEAAA